MLGGTGTNPASMSGVGIRNTNILSLPAPDKKTTVSIMKDTTLQYPELWLEVFVVSHGDKMEERNFANLFIKSKCTRATSIDTADLVVFVGGTDVDPSLYEEERHFRTEDPDKRRDEAEMAIYNECLDKGVPMFGVCRGAQFLHVMNGGKLYQHVDSHYGDHRMWDVKDRYLVQRVSSVHHQACIRNSLGGMEVLGDAVGAHERWRNPTECVRGPSPDIEAFFYADTLSFGVQFHPEYAGYDESAVWTMKHIEELFVDNPDTMNLNRYRRLKPEVLAAREAMWAEAAALSNREEDFDDEITEDQIADLDALGLDLPDDLDPAGIKEILAEAEKMKQQQDVTKSQQEAA